MSAKKLRMQGSLRTLFNQPKAEDGDDSIAQSNENDIGDTGADDVQYVPVWEALPKEVWSKRNVHAPKHHDAVHVSFCTRYNLMQRKEIKLMCRKKKIFIAQFLLPILIVACFNLRALLLRTEVEVTDFTPFVLSPVQMEQCDGTILLAPPFNQSSIVKTIAEFLNNETTTSNLKFDQHPNMALVSQSVGNSCGTVHFTDAEILDDQAMANISGVINYVLPKRTNYQIRLRAIQWSLFNSKTKNKAFYAEPSKWATDRIYPKHLVIGPRNQHDNEGGEPGYASEGFLYLQRRIDLALISLIYKQQTGQDFKNEYFVQLERFPFPAFESTNMIYLIQFELPFVLLFAFLTQVVICTYLAVWEKETGAKAFLKSFGVSNFLQLLPFILKIMIQYTLVNLVITFLLCAKWYEDGLHHVALIDLSSSSLVFVLLEIVTFNVCALSYLISVFFVHAAYAACTAGFYWVCLNLPFLYFSLRNFIQNPLPIQFFSSLFAQSGLRTALQYISISEINVGGTQWDDLLQTKFDVGHILLMLFVGGVVNMFLAAYIENIYPTSVNRRHLVPLPKLYFIRRWWWKGQLPPDNNDAPEDTEAAPLSGDFEKEPKRMKLEYQIKGLSKCYVGDVGIFNITMNFYEGEISVILGTKGSGKSTLFGLLSGIILPTRGAILLKTVDVQEDPAYLRYNLGICPQENFLYDFLTVEEHITLYALLKGFRSMADAFDECEALTQALKLKSVRDHRAKTLTYSQKRLVHIAIAFCAGSKVVVLDEPTVNMDASSKRIVWEFLQKEKKRRTIIVLTSDTEEANFVTDRISILVSGEIRCRGSLSFINAKFGGGYLLTAFKGSRFNAFDVTDFVKSAIPNSSVANEDDEFISYNLPGEYAFQFPALLEHLESRTTSYDIENITISYVTMEEVFKKICKANESETKIEFKRRHTLDHSPELDSQTVPASAKKESVLVNFCRQFYYLLLKHARVMYRRKLWLLLPYVIAICLMVAICIIIASNPFDKNLPPHPINFDKLKQVIDPGILLQCEEQYNGNNFCSILTTVASRYAHIHVVDATEIGSKTENLILRTYNRKRSIAASELVLAVNTAHGTTNGITTQVTVFFDNQALHVVPVAVNFASNLILTHVLTSTSNVATDYEITAENYPLEYQTIQTLGLAEDYSSNGFYLGLAFTWAMTFFMPILIVFPIREKYFKHTQFICGVNSFLFWFTTVLWDFILYELLVIIVFLILHFTNVFQYNRDSATFVQLVLLLHAYGFAAIGLVNCLVPLIKGSGLVGYFYTWLIFFFTGPLILSTLLITNEEDKESLFALFMKKILDAFLIFPNCALGLGVFHIYARYRFDAECTEEHRTHICHTAKSHGCCIADPFFHYQTGFGIGENIVALLAVGVLTHLLTLFLETDTCRIIYLWLRSTRLARCCCCCFEKKKKVVIITEDPLPEVDFGDDRSSGASIERVGDDEKYEIVISNLLHQSKEGRVVLDVPKLRLRKYECNCCLGLDGSGKSLLLQVVAGLVVPDMGDVKINKKSLLRNYRKYIKQISYSPDHPALLAELTGSETLTLCAVLSRVPASKMKPIITSLCLKLNLFDDLENRVGDYSPGALKKLAIAIAIINNPEILICEEPTRDVDPASRLQIIKALTDLKKTVSILISTSDMELCEQLCDRVVVFGRTGGRIRCYGSPSYLKSTYCDNMTITATLIPDAPYTYYPGNVVELGWDYDKDIAPEILTAPSTISMLKHKPSVQSIKPHLKPGANIISKDKVRYHPRTAETQPHASTSDPRRLAVKASPSLPNAKDYVRSMKATKPATSQMSIHTLDGNKHQRSFSLFPANRVASETAMRHGSRFSIARPSIVSHHSHHRPSVYSVAPKMSIFGSLFSSKDLPKYEYESSSSDTFTSATVMEHWQVELIPLINFIESQFPDAELINIYPCFVQYLLRNEVRLSDTFKKMAIAKKYLDVENFFIGNMSLEQFFLHYIEGQTYEERQ